MSEPFEQAASLSRPSPSPEIGSTGPGPATTSHSAGSGQAPSTGSGQGLGDGVLENPVAAGAAWLEGGLAILDAGGGILTINEPFANWLDQTVAALAGTCLWDHLKDRCSDWLQPLFELVEGTAPFAELRLQLPSGSQSSSQWFSLELARQGGTHFVRFNSTLPPLVDLAEATWDEYLREESARREMFIRLLRAESQLKALAERWPGVIFSQRADFTFRYASPKIEELTGVSIADWQTKPHLFWHVVHEGDVEELLHQLRQAKESGQPATLTYRIRHVHSGRVAYVMEHRQPNVSRGGLLLGYEGVWLDVTRQTIAERRLSSAAWKETLSILTMGLAHDFGNVMAGIHSLSESFLEQAGQNHDFSEGLTLIKRNAEQASQLVVRIINLHQGKTGERQYHDLNEIATDLADLARKILPSRMRFSLELSPTALPVYVDAVELRQVVINLVLNAIDAMPIPRAGRLLVRTADHPALPALARFQGKTPRAPVASLSVHDSGSGIKARHQACIFDPFFTTKPANKGSGLGLYNARLFVEKHHGGISVDTEEGVGTAFHLWLPQADFTEGDPSTSSGQAPSTGSGPVPRPSLGAEPGRDF